MGTELIDTKQISENMIENSYKPENQVFAKAFSELFRPENLETKMREVLANDKGLAERAKQACESGDPGKIGRIRGEVMNRVIEQQLAPYVADAQTEVSVKGANGKSHRTDYTATATKDIYFSRDPADTLQEGQRFSVENKTGGVGYLRSELRKHGSDQSAAHEGKSVIFVSADFKDLPLHTQSEIRIQNREHNTIIVAGLPRASVMDKCMGRAVGTRDVINSQPYLRT
ncbi:MAG: hypothetical protein WCK54_14875 [Desulfuromonadales bacterium]